MEKKSELIGREITVLDRGFVRLLDYMGGDDDIVAAARVSYGKGTKQRREDRGLIRYLMRHQHTTPFEMVEFKFHVKLPIFVARQWIRHRTANVNEYSGRYSVMNDEFYVPRPEDVKKQSASNRQGRAESSAAREGELDPAVRDAFINFLNTSNRQLFDHYLKAIDDGIARELARINLPLSLYTQWYWKIDLHNLFHFLRLRLDPHAQWEIREYAKAMASLVKKVVPLAWEAFEDYQLNAAQFSLQELKLLFDRLTDSTFTEEQLIAAGLSRGEARESLEKLERIRAIIADIDSSGSD